MPVHHVTNTSEFESFIKKDNLVVVDFFAEWCGPCKIIAPKFQKFSDDYSAATFIKVDVDQVADVAASCGIRAMPTFQFYKKGAKVAEVVGADVKKLEETIKNNL
ncbi:thioredoxine 2 [Rozella allomycis CSF55]|uniref:Thioredoxin n=1 Tax=Rozella allomycis (strain CSF55) TaxID=988480 RepID=A0A075ASJ9_ROZAC|nr:Thioredoxin-1 [Rozella allomycis CSF55]RKP19039.1 thioredoxine 2 [Rozella allomycis CSF55]|eukprot:EPZ33238.1 Thioredoxin-1 [Rozella allomycis CSF55]